jgi:hypothetical protein
VAQQVGYCFKLAVAKGAHGIAFPTSLSHVVGCQHCVMKHQSGKEFHFLLNNSFP